MRPEQGKDGFNCPYCHAYAEQRWGRPLFYANNSLIGQINRIWTSQCTRCKELAFWVDGKLVYPSTIIAPEPNPDLPDDIAEDFNEARQLLSISPRGAAALLRLCIQKLCIELGKSGKNINSDIGDLVKDGLPVKVQQALDLVRVVGNNAVHPGQIDLKDNETIASNLFGLVNLIAEVMITQPKHVQAMFDEVVPEGQKQAIAKRDDA